MSATATAAPTLEVFNSITDSSSGFAASGYGRVLPMSPAAIKDLGSGFGGAVAACRLAQAGIMWQWWNADAAIRPDHFLEISRGWTPAGSGRRGTACSTCAHGVHRLRPGGRLRWLPDVRQCRHAPAPGGVRGVLAAPVSPGGAGSVFRPRRAHEAPRLGLPTQPSVTFDEPIRGEDGLTRNRFGVVQTACIHWGRGRHRMQRGSQEHPRAHDHDKPTRGWPRA